MANDVAHPALPERLDTPQVVGRARMLGRCRWSMCVCWRWCRHRWRVWRGGVSRADRRLFTTCCSSARSRSSTTSSLFTPASPWGALVILVPVIGGLGVTFIVTNIRAGSEGAWRAGSHGRHLLQERRDQADRRGCEITCFGVVDRQRRGRRARRARSSRSARRSVPRWAVDPHVDGTAHHPGCRRRRRRHRRDVQHTHRRCAVRHRADDAGDQRQHLHAGGIATGTATFIGRVFFGDTPAFDVPAEPRDLAGRMEELGDPAVLTWHWAR